MRSYLQSTTQNMSSSWNSDPFRIQNCTFYAVECVVSGVTSQSIGVSHATGSFSLQVSNAIVNTVTAPLFKDQVPATSWVTFPSSSQAIIGNDTVIYNVKDASYNFARLAYSSSSGMGTGSITFLAKGAS